MNVFLHCSIWNSVDDSRYCLLFDHGKYRYRCRYHFSNSVPLLCLLNRSSHFEKPTVCFIRFLLCRETRSSLRIRQSVSYSLALPTFLLYRSFVYVLQHVDIRQLPSFNEQDNSRSVSFPLYLYPLLRGYHGEPIIESRDGRRLDELRKAASRVQWKLALPKPTIPWKEVDDVQLREDPILEDLDISERRFTQFSSPTVFDPCSDDTPWMSSKADGISTLNDTIRSSMPRVSSSGELYLCSLSTIPIRDIWR